MGLSGFLFGISFGTRVSMQVLALNAKLGLDALQVGYVYVACAIVTVCVGVWVTPRLFKWFGVYTTAILASLFQGVTTVYTFVYADGIWVCLSFLAASTVGFSVRMASNGPITAKFADSSNRGAVFARVQMYTNFGRMVGPVLSGHLAEKDPVTLPWILSGCCMALSALLLIGLARSQAAVETKKDNNEVSSTRLLRGFTDLLCDDGDLEQEVGNSDDYERIGRYVGELLKQRNYRWVSKQEAVLHVIDKLIPALSVQRVEQVADLELLVRHAEGMQKELGKLGEPRGCM